MKTGVILAAVASLTTLAARPGMAQNLILNGDFETPVVTVNSQLYQQFFAPTTIPNWTVGTSPAASGPGAAGVDVIRRYWTPFSGSQSLDLNANNAGTLSQTVALTANKKYALDFYMAGNPVGGSTLKSMNIFFNDGSSNVFNQNTTFNAAGKSRTNMGWQFRHFEFVPSTSGNFNLSFVSNNSGQYGAALDLLNLHAMIPEPGTAGLMAAGLLPLGMLLRRRRK